MKKLKTQLYTLIKIGGILWLPKRALWHNRFGSMGRTGTQLSATTEGRIPEDYNVWWRYEDEKLFDFAKEDLKKLAAGDKPINMTMLTVDTHFMYIPTR